MSRSAGLSRVATIVAAILVTGACHAARANGDELTPAQKQFGVYRFSERISANNPTSEIIDLEGQFVVLGDTVTVEARPGPCEYDTRTTLGGPILYQCGQNLTLSFDRHQPVARATYKALVAIRETQRICVRYTVDPSGRRICVETSTQTVERMVTQAGHLRTQRMTSEPPAL
jgi:hypothetical protein